MPNRYGENSEEQPLTDWERQLIKAQAIAHCGLCDEDGYHGSTVCDHIDHAEAAKRGIALIRSTMGWDK